MRWAAGPLQGLKGFRGQPTILQYGCLPADLLERLAQRRTLTRRRPLEGLCLPDCLQQQPRVQVFHGYNSATTARYVLLLHAMSCHAATASRMPLGSSD